MTPRYRLHYAPDNASLIIRLALEELSRPYETVLVDRPAGALDSQTYRALNPQGLIPVLETEDGPIFETAAILLWLGDRHHALVPDITSADRGWVLKWLFYLSNTLHADLRILFYPHKYVGCDQGQQEALHQGLTTRLVQHLAILEEAAREDTGWLAGDTPSALDLYLACMMRWMALYPMNRNHGWFDISATPRIAAMLARLENRPSVRAAQTAEGLGNTPFTHPDYANPPEGSAT